MYGLPGIFLIMIPISIGFYQILPLFIPMFAILITIPLVELITHFFPDIFGSNQWRSKPKPTFSIARGLKKQEKYIDALAELERMAREDPQEVDIWLEMLEIALMDLKDRNIADPLYRDALSVLESQQSRNAVTTFYENIIRG
ncbi:MAG TPA: hypothetical protein PLV45_00250 [bacterium]|nr:hypothetical protein [bacterium]